MKKSFKVLLTALLATMAITGVFTTGSTESVTGKAPAPTKIKFYGKIVEYSSGIPMTEKLVAQLKDKYEIEAIQVDWGNLEKIIKVGITSNEPADVYQYWPQEMSTFVESKMALDLTPYLEANGGEWKNTFNQAMLEMGKYDGKYYNLPLSANFSLMYANMTLFDQAGVALPDFWTWDQFLASAKQIQEKTGAYPFAIARDLQGWLVRNGIMSVALAKGQLADLENGKVPASSEIFGIPLANTKSLYESLFWYPGEGALTTSRDEAKAAFYQGKVALLAEVSASAKDIITGGSFKIVPVAWPSMGQPVVLGGCDGLFIPANARNKDAAVEILKTYLGPAIQKIHADAGFAVSNVNIQVADPVTKRIIALSSTVHSKEFFSLSSKLNEYFEKDVVAAYSLSANGKDVIEKIEALRQEVLSK